MLPRAMLVSSKPVGLRVLIPDNVDGLRTPKEFRLNSRKDFVRHKVPTAERRIGLTAARLGGSGGVQFDVGGEPASAGAGQAIGAGGDSQESQQQQNDAYGKLVSAIGLIMGTAVGPGILGLPAATLPAGFQASSLMILGAWAYVTASILLVAELSCAVMADEGQKEVSFTGLVSHTLGYSGACAVAVVYASLNYALLVACIAGVGSILRAWLGLPVSVHLLSAASAAAVGMLVAFAPFKIIDGVNRGLCGLMIAAITSLVGLGIYAGRELWGVHQPMPPLSIASFSSVITSFPSVLQAVPVTVLTLGFHVITPVVCRVVGGKPEDARRAVLVGGAIPLAMVLAWNGVVFGLAPAQSPSPSPSPSLNPIELLLSVSASAASFVQAFAFAALGTTLIGYALSFPKQLGDAFDLVLRRNVFDATQPTSAETAAKNSVTRASSSSLGPLIWAIAPPAAVAVFWPTAFASSLDFAGIYANCFLFGVLPPVMAWVYRYRQPTK